MFFGFTLPGDITLGDELLINVDTKSRFYNVGSIISALLPRVFILGGIVLLGMLLLGGFEILTSVGNEDKLKGGIERIKNAFFGFLTLFGVYWLAQIAQILFKIPIL